VAITYRGASATPVNQSSGTGGTPTLPSGWANNDLAFLVCLRNSTTEPSSSPSGWTLLGGSGNTQGTYRGWVYYRVLQTGDSAPTVTWGANGKTQCYVYCFYAGATGDYDTSSPIQASAASGDGVSDTTLPVASSDSGTLKCPRILLAASYSTSAKTATPFAPTVPGTYTEHSDTGSTTPDFWQYVDSYTTPFAGASTATDMAISAAAIQKFSWHIAIKPAAGYRNYAVTLPAALDFRTAQSVTEGVVWLDPAYTTFDEYASSGSWVTKDLSSYIASGALAAVFRVRIGVPSAGGSYGARCYGSTDPVLGWDYNSWGTIMVCPVDSSRRCQVYAGSSTAGDCMYDLIGYVPSGAGSFNTDRGSSVAPGTTGSWQTVTDSGAPSGAKAGIYIIEGAASATTWGARAYGSTDNRTPGLTADVDVCFIVGLDSSKRFEAYISAAMGIYPVGYITSGIVCPTNRSNYATTSGSWLDMSSLPSGIRGGFFEPGVNDSSGYWGVRENSTDNDIPSGGVHPMDNAMLASGVDSGGAIEGYRSTTTPQMYLAAYTVNSELSYPPLGKAVTRLKSLAAALSAVASLTKVDNIGQGTQYTRDLFVSVAGSVSMSRVYSWLKTLSASVAAAATISLALTLGRTLSASVTGAVTLARQLSAYRTLSASAAGAATLARAVTYLKSLTTSVAGSATLIQQKLKLLTLSASASLSASLSKVSSLTRTLSASFAGAATLAKSFGKALAASFAGAATLATIKVKLIVLSVSLAGSATLSRTFAWARQLAASMTGAATLAKTLTLGRTLSASVAGSATLAKIVQRYRTLSASVAGAATLTRIKVKIMVLSVSAGFSASLTRTLSAYRTLSASVAAAATLAKLSTLYRSLSASVAGSATLSRFKFVSRLLAASASFGATMTRRLSAARAFSASGSLTVGLLKVVSLSLGQAALTATGTLTKLIQGQLDKLPRTLGRLRLKGYGGVFGKRWSTKIDEGLDVEPEEEHRP
jgi:hypothetical protein